MIAVTHADPGDADGDGNLDIVYNNHNHQQLIFS